VFGPAINHHLYRSEARQRVLQRLGEFGDVWGGAAGDAEAYEIGLSIFPDMERGESSVAFLHELMREHWEVSETDEVWNDEVLLRLRRAMSDLWQKKDAQEEARRAQRRAEELKRKAATERRRAEEAEAKAKRENDAKLHDQIARELGITKRHARNLRSEGTRDPERARRLAEITGDDPSKFLKTGRRKRETDLVKMFMTAEHGHVSFTHFISDEDDEIADDELRSFLKENVRKLTWGEDLDSLESLVHRMRDLGYELSLETAEDLWKAYKLWRIRTISSIAICDVEDGR
jgi:hypothetical protein